GGEGGWFRQHWCRAAQGATSLVAPGSSRSIQPCETLRQPHSRADRLHPAPGYCRSCGVSMRGAEGLVQVGEEIIRVLEPDRETQQINRTGRALDRAAMLDQALNAAQRGGTLPQLDLGGSRDGGRLSSLRPD